MPLPCYRKLDMSTDRGRVLPLGGSAPSSSGFRGHCSKTVDTPNAYHKFSKRTAQKPSASNDSQLTPRSGAMSALGEITYLGGKRPITPSRGQTNSFMNDPEPSAHGGIRQSGYERKVIQQREWQEDHPRKLVKHVPQPERQAVNSEGLSPFITANGMIGKFHVSESKAKKNSASTTEDMDTRSMSRRREMEVSGRMSQRYNSTYRAASKNTDRSPMRPETMPLSPEIAQSGLAKQQRFAPSRRNEQSLHGVFHKPTNEKKPPPYKLVPPFFTSTD